ncbi:hypothetical protein [Clostridium neonatale]|uniref:hypothetical protein n=1 Tax=Clostridium neonatale TaxID=137838 RepID=UPI00397DA7B2
MHSAFYIAVHNVISKNLCTAKIKPEWRKCLLKKYYEDAGDNAAFERFVEVLCRIIQKYGKQVLKSQNGHIEQMADVSDGEKQNTMIEDKAA